MSQIWVRRKWQDYQLLSRLRLNSLASEIKLAKISFEEYLKQRNPPKEHFSFNLINASTIKKIIFSLQSKKTEGFDGRSNHLIKHCKGNYRAINVADKFIFKKRPIP